MQSNKMHWAVSVSVRFNPNKVKPPSMPNFKTLLLRYVRVQSFENTPRLTTAEFFNVALTLGAGLCFVCMACKQFKHECSIYWLMFVWTSKDVNPLCMTVGWQPTMVKYCMMHTLHLGICHWVNAGALLTLIHHNFFGSSTAKGEHTKFNSSSFMFFQELASKAPKQWQRSCICWIVDSLTGAGCTQ